MPTLQASGTDHPAPAWRVHARHEPMTPLASPLLWLPSTLRHVSPKFPNPASIQFVSHSHAPGTVSKHHRREVSVRTRTTCAVDAQRCHRYYHLQRLRRRRIRRASACRASRVRCEPVRAACRISLLSRHPKVPSPPVSDDSRGGVSGQVGVTGRAARYSGSLRVERERQLWHCRERQTTECPALRPWGMVVVPRHTSVRLCGWAFFYVEGI